MVEFLIEIVPFVVGAGLGLAAIVTVGRRLSPWPLITVGSIAVGGFQAMIAGEISGDWLESLGAVIADSAAAAAGWIGIQLLMRRGDRERAANGEAAPAERAIHDERSIR